MSLKRKLSTDDDTESIGSLFDKYRETEKDDETLDFKKDFLTTSEFIKNTKLNLATIATNELFAKANISWSDIITVLDDMELSQETFIKFLDAESKVTRNITQYSDKVYNYLYSLLLTAYSSKLDDEALVICELVMSTIMVYKSSGKAISDLKTLFSLEFERKMSGIGIAKKLKLASMNIRKDQSMEPIIDTDNSGIKDYLGDHYVLYTECIEHYMNLGFIFHAVKPASDISYHSLSTSSVNSKKDDVTINVPALRLNMSMPILVNIQNKAIKTGHKVINLSRNVTYKIVEALKESIRFYDDAGNPVDLEFYESATVCNLQNVHVSNINKDFKDSYQNNLTKWSVDLLDDTQQMYVVIDSVNLIYSESLDSNKITIKVFPKMLKSNVDSQKVAMINFTGSAEIEHLRNIE